MFDMDMGMMDMDAGMMDRGLVDMDMGMDRMDMGMGDMNMGMRDMDRGARDMEIGAMDFRSDRPIAGMERIALGERDMMRGDRMMERGVIDRGLEVEMMQARAYQTKKMMRGVGYCPPGCMLECCRPVEIGVTLNQTAQLESPIVLKEKQRIFTGRIFQLTGSDWLPIEAQLTEQAFGNIRIDQITKIKIKAQSRLSGTKLIKICTFNEDFFFSVAGPEQIEWMAHIVWAKLASMGRMCNINDAYDGRIQGEILKKGFFGGWDAKFGNITGPIFKISNMAGEEPQKVIVGVPQIWTRFQFERNGMLIVKMHHGGFKVEVAVPAQRTLGWLRGLYHLITI